MILTQVTNYVDGVSVPFGSVAVGYTAVLTVSGSVRKIYVVNTLNASVDISLNGGTNTFITLLAGRDLEINLDNSMHWSGVISIRQSSIAPISGAISFGVILGA